MTRIKMKSKTKIPDKYKYVSLRICNLAIICSLLVMLNNAYAIPPPEVCEISFREVDKGIVHNRNGLPIVHQGENITFTIGAYGGCFRSHYPFNITVENNCIGPKQTQDLEMTSTHHQYELPIKVNNNLQYFSTCDISVIRHPESENLNVEKLSLQMVPYKIQFSPERMKMMNSTKNNETLSITNYEDFPVKIRFDSKPLFVTGSWRINNEGKREKLIRIAPCSVKFSNTNTSFEIDPNQSLDITMELENEEKELMRCYIQPFTVEGPKGAIQYPLNYYSFYFDYERLSDSEVSKDGTTYIQQFMLIIIFIIILIVLGVINKSSRRKK